MSGEGEKKGVKNFLADILTEDDGGTIFDFVRVLAVLGGVVLMGLAIYHGVMDFSHINIDEVGRGFAQYFAGVGAAIWGKGKSGA